jgi:transposase
VVRIAKEKDVEILRQAALLLARENDRLSSRLATALAENAELRGESDEQLALRLSALEAELARTRAKMFGSSTSEKTKTGAADATSEKPSKPGHGPKEQPTLPVVDDVLDLDEADRVCNACGGALDEWPNQFEESKVVDVLPRRFVVRHYRRKKYRCACGACIETALPAPSLCAGARYSVDFAIEVATCKYLEHGPLERQVRAMKREGLCVDSQTLWDQIERLAQLLTPAYERLHEYVLSHDVVGADETRWRIMGKEAGPEGGSKWWQIWLVQCPTAVYYTIENTRGIDGGNELLAGYRGTVMCDGYAVYKAIEKAAVGLKLAHCWAHFRREILAHEQAYPEIVAGGLALIRNLYAVEEACRDEPDEVRRSQRNSLSRAVVDEIQRWMLSTWGAVPPGSGLRGALTYGAGLWSGLTRFLEDPKIGLDNNPSERAARGPVVGRKNHYGSRSKRGTEVAALFYTLLESAKLAGVEPKAYLRAATLASLNGDVIPLPHEWSALA